MGKWRDLVRKESPESEVADCLLVNSIPLSPVNSFSQKTPSSLNPKSTKQPQLKITTNRSGDNKRGKDYQADMINYSGRGSVLDPLLYEEHTMGKDRRKFLIVCVFAFSLTTLLWLLSTVSQGDDWAKVFYNEINIFEPHFFQTSLFDVVLIAFIKMTFLLTIYAICIFKHWAPVALSTSGTTIFLAIKILFFFNQSKNSLPQYLVIVSTFCTGWFELWLMPFRVLPRERHACYDSTHDLTIAEQRIPVRVREEAGSSSARMPISYVTDEDAFGTARDYSSEEEQQSQRGSTVQGSDTENLTISDYQAAISNAEAKAKAIFNDVSTWKTLSEGNAFISYNEATNSYYIKATCEANTYLLYQISWIDQKNYNSQIKSSESLLTVDECTEIVYSVSNAAMLGHISSRDFLDIRRITYNPEQDIFNGVFVSIKSAIKPPDPTNKIIRGQNGINLIRISKIDETHSLYEWIFNSDIKGKVPVNLIKSGSKSFLQSYIKSLQKYIKTDGHKYSQNPYVQ